jgi:hypothetical protein
MGYGGTLAAPVAQELFRPMGNSEAFVALKRRVMDILQEEVLRSLGLASAR